MRTRIVMNERTLHQMSAFHAFGSEWPYESLWCFAIHFWSHCGLLLHEFHHQHSFPVLSQKTVAISFLAGRQRLFKLLWLVGWMCVHPLLWLLLVSTFTNETQVSSPVTHTTRLRNTSPSLWYRAKKSKPKPFYAFLCTSEPILHKVCGSLA
jgi:hypothetical protein